MVSKEVTVMVNVLILPNGTVKFLVADRTSLETELQKWNKTKSDEHREHETYGGMVQCKMLASEWFMMQKEFKQHG